MSMIKVEELTKIYEKKPVVDELFFELTPGKCVALLGPNGAGKTTTLRMLSGLLKPSKGTISFDDINKNGDVRNYIGYLPQHPVFHTWMSGKEFLVYVGQLAHLTKQEASERADKLLERVGIADAKNKRIGKYSGGMKQRLGIAQALIHNPVLLMLDEPVSALDPIGRREVLTLMEELKKEMTILFSTHILGDAEEISDDLLLMHNGKILESGSIDELRSKYQTARVHVAFRDNLDTYKEALDQMHWVTESFIDRQELLLDVTDVEQARSDIFQKAIQENWPVTKFEISRTTLEDLFMKVVSQ